jgi:hypothetical protein
MPAEGLRLMPRSVCDSSPCVRAFRIPTRSGKDSLVRHLMFLLAALPLALAGPKLRRKLKNRL